MPASYDDAVTELFRAPHDAFVAERKRLAGELKAAGDKDGAARLAKLHRPPVSVWAVNQLWWRDRRDFEAMLETAERLRGGDLGAGGPHREAIAKLRARAAALLSEGGHGASEVTLRRVTTTLSAIAAAGGFAPDEPGMLTEDRDPPGFETMGLAAAAASHGGEHRHAARPHGKRAEDAEEEEAEAEADEEERADDREKAKDKKESEQEQEKEREKEERAREREEREKEQHRRAAEAARERAEAAAERRREEEAAARRKAQRERVEAALRTAEGEVHRLERDLEKLRASVTAAEDRLVRAKEIAADLEGKLADLK